MKSLKGPSKESQIAFKILSRKLKPFPPQLEKKVETQG